MIYRILICGDRNWEDYIMIDDFVKSLPEDKKFFKIKEGKIGTYMEL